jgi:hypothetical protein
MAATFHDRAVSSAVEHYLDMVGVTGSIPVPPTSGFCRRPDGRAKAKRAVHSPVFQMKHGFGFALLAFVFNARKELSSKEHDHHDANLHPHLTTRAIVPMVK